MCSGSLVERAVGFQMGISMAVLATPDAELRQFSKAPGRLELMLNRVIGGRGEGMVSLENRWKWAHALLAETPRDPHLPMGLLMVGDIAWEGLSDPAHGVYSPTVRAFVDQLEGVSDPILRRRFANAIEDGFLRRTSAFSEAAGALSVLRSYAERAASREEGLIFCRWEDW